MNRNRISVIVTTLNEQRTIGRCLESLRGFRDVLLVDSFSDDRTLEIAASYPVRIVQHRYESAARQKNWALQQVHHDWVLILDADEALTPDLRSEIEALAEPPPREGYWIRRDSEYLGRRIRHCGWQRDKVLRLFRRDAGAYEELEVHEEVVLRSEPGILGARLLHDPYADVAHHLRKMKSYTALGARDFVHRGGRFAFLRMLFHPPFRFLRMYVMQAGILDGFQGFVLCLLSAYGVMLKYAKAWSYGRASGDGGMEPTGRA
jgi:glycosyltransferase involved in cell wall biosynthesis